MRDESHRFAIEFQRALRRKVGLTSILEEIPGIGPGKRRALLKELGSLKGVREASLEELAEVRGVTPRDARTLHAFFAALAQPEPPEGVVEEGTAPVPAAAADASNAAAADASAAAAADASDAQEGPRAAPEDAPSSE